MKIKIVVFASLIILLLSPIRASAQPSAYNDLPNVLNDIQVTENRATFSLADINVSEAKLVGPFSETSISFNIPPNWQLVSGSSIQLQFDVIVNNIGGNLPQNVTYIGGANLIVQFNDILLGVITINESGSYTQQFLIPNSALVSQRVDRRHELTIILDAQAGCNYDLSVFTNIKTTSIVDLFYQQADPQLDLSRLPAPFYLSRSIVLDDTLVVVGDNPEPAELQSALNVFAGFGSMIDNDYNIQLINYSSLNDNLLHQNHLIFIGLPENFSILSTVNFKSPITNGKIERTSDDDGVLQLAISPWNSSKVVMLVGGNTLDGVSKSGYAVSTGNVLIYQEPDVAYVSSVKFLPSEIPVVEKFTFEDIGYTTTILEGTGSVSEGFLFYISRPQAVSTDAYIEFTYNHSGLAEYSSSLFSLYLNGNVFFSKVLSTETEQVTTLQVRIPPGYLRYGENTLEVDVDLLAFPGCDTVAIAEPWFAISNQSLFFIPVPEEQQVSQLLLRDLKFFPELFTTSSDLSDVAFVIPRSNQEAWQIAAQLAYMLGETVQSGLSNITIAYADSVTDEVRTNKSLIVIGKATDLPFISEINDTLPAPFDLINNIASERQLTISYRIPDGQDVGYLELLPSPFNSEKTILFISGNTDGGVLLAGNTLTLDSLQSQLAGVFAVTNGTQIAIGNANSSFSIVGEGVPGAEQVINAPLPSQSVPLALAPPSWLFHFIVGSFVIIGILIIIILRRFIIKRRFNYVSESLLEAERSETNDDDNEE